MRKKAALQKMAADVLRGRAAWRRASGVPACWRKQEDRHRFMQMNLRHHWPRTENGWSRRQKCAIELRAKAD
jgi:hypothetical protein